MITLSAERCPQGSLAWHAARLGIPTASQFHRIMSVKTRKPLAGAETYANELLAEWLIGESIGPESRGFLQRGTAMEQDARAWYAFDRNVDVEEVGFVLNDARTVGCSPDGFVGADGGVEFKCPAAHVHVATLLDKGDAHVAQVQGNLWLTERAWWDLVSYNPVMPRVRMEFARDDEFIGQLAEAVAAFCARLEAKRAELLALGCVPTHTRDEAVLETVQ